ncbi:ABC transporter ATP-binding protein [Alkalihalobacillus sp. AL-G]|uniref:ABC transporter ATP-binding protein n=1 Tax=Alkalihalobacillus sp. AL-G TaxID=2926399 RepID=UPI00272BC7E8|nr:ABC transporter ATP-binding protein [Alkalihalobacillus sp. AL-G]WLD92019.1 ABC transporter ATP-binding protein [Alkalihalobacillus sp. AL-G]
METILNVENLTAHYVTEKGEARAVEDVSFTVRKREMLGLIGESGCGKTTVAQSILRLLEYPGKIVSGKAVLDGNDLIQATEKELEKIRWSEISVIPQSAMNALNPIYTIGDQIIESIRTHNSIDKKEAIKRTKELLELVGIDGERWKSYPHEFSGGMKQRVAIAMALSCSPKLIISDESTTGLDVLTQAQIIALLKKLQLELDLSIILISHDLPMVTAVCDRIAIMYAGKITEWADTKDIVYDPNHPYTKGLLDATPDITQPDKKVSSIPGTVPNLIQPPAGCRFYSRCPYAMEKCNTNIPPLIQVKPAHYSACFLAEEDVQ